MADSVQSFNRNRTIFIFAVGLIVLGLIFLGSLWFSNERGDQFGRLATTDGIKTEDVKKPEENRVAPEKEAPKQPEEKKNSNQAQTTPEKKKETPQPSTPKPQPKREIPPAQAAPVMPAVPRTGPSDQGGSLPATGSEGWYLAIPILLIIGYVYFEFRRSRQAIQRAAYHENSGILTLDS